MRKLASSKAKDRKRGRGGQAAFEDDGAEAHEQAMEELRDRLQRKIEALRDRLIREEGYTLDEATGGTVPPGYIRDPDYVPRTRD